MRSFVYSRAMNGRKKKETRKRGLTIPETRTSKMYFNFARGIKEYVFFLYILRIWRRFFLNKNITSVMNINFKNHDYDVNLWRVKCFLKESNIIFYRNDINTYTDGSLFWCTCVLALEIFKGSFEKSEYTRRFVPRLIGLIGSWNDQELSNLYQIQLDLLHKVSRIHYILMITI